MRLVKDCKTSEASKAKPNKTTKKTSIKTGPCDSPGEKTPKKMIKTEDVFYEECGPSSGVRLTEAQREANLCEVFKLQKNLLRNLQLEDEEDESED